ncbi:MAG: chromosome segregation protein SMC [Candidatus Aenigmarchaeota archaeon]|nr:chromosome segregation protein SMC [Candidatus Aenigmarchaeota archaeon]
MVYFEKMVLHGFKSFSKPTTIPLYKGFNAVIGPNGSGKSNLADAIVFVLGSTSRALRAGRLDHVIYNGGHGKKPAEKAVVSLHINNESGKIEGLGNRIEIARTVNRRGVSIYRMDNRVTNRSEIFKVLAQVGLTPEAHNTIQQGDITQIVKMRPRERREIIDTVAGINEYTDKKAKAIDELAIAERNISDASLVLEQKAEFLKKMRAERDAATKYKNLEEERDIVKANIAYTRIQAVEGALENVTNTIKMKEAEYDSLKGKVVGFDTDLDDLEDEIKKVEDEILKKSVNAEMRKEIEEIIKTELKREGQIEANRREIIRLEDMIEKINAIHSRSMAEDTNRNVREVLASGMAGLEGTLASLFRVDSRYETAIRVAMGGHLNDIVVKNERTASDGINYLKSNNLGRVRFLPLDRMSPNMISAKAEIASKMPGILGFAIELVKFDKKYKDAFGNALRSTLVAEDMSSARNVRGMRVVTLDGELFEAGGAIVGGRLSRAAARSPAKSSSSLTDASEYEKAIEELEAENVELRAEIGELNKLLDEKRKLEKKESGDVVGLQKRKEEILKEMDDHKQSRKGRYEDRLSMESEINNMKLRRARLEAEYDNFKMDYEKYKDRTDLQKGDLAKMERRVRDIERSLKSMGLVNLKAIEEFDEFEKDYQSLKEKIDKLLEERGSIENMILQIEEKRKIMFNGTLQQVSEEFGVVFKQLADGTAELVMEDPNDIESGLLIRAQPKDKRLLSIDALSGGEKTLTAIAFLFAIQRYKPCAFYMLDEADAALDKMNSEKIGDIIQKYSDEAQFLVISHNDATVRRSERIYGVSMQDGVSQIFGVKLDEDGKAVKANN